MVFKIQRRGIIVAATMSNLYHTITLFQTELYSIVVFIFHKNDYYSVFYDDATMRCRLFTRIVRQTSTLAKSLYSIKVYLYSYSNDSILIRADLWIYIYVCFLWRKEIDFFKYGNFFFFLILCIKHLHVFEYRSNDKYRNLLIF